MSMFDFLKKTHNNKMSNASTFKELIDDVAKNGGGTVRLYRKDDETNAKFFVSEKDANDMKDTDPEQWIKNGYGGGNYVVRVEKADAKGVEKLVKEFRFSINGEPKESLYESHKRKTADQDMAATMTQSVLSFAKDMFPKKDDSSMVALIQSNTQMMQAMMTQFMESQKSQLDMMIRVLENSKKNGNPINETLEGIMQLSQVRDMLTPNVTEDKTLEWAKLFMGSPFTSGLMGKITGIEIPQTKALPLAEIQTPGDNALGGSASSRNATPSGQHPIKVPHPDPSINDPSSSISETRDDFESVMLDPIMELINAQADPADIAQSIHQVINWTLTSLKANIQPHPIMIEFIQAIIAMANGNLELDPLNTAYMNFTKNIEMPEELINPVKEELIKLYMPTLIQMKARKQVIIDAEEGKNETSKTI